MENQSKQHVQVPDPVQNSGLQYTDYLVYGTLRMHMNGNTYEAYPSVQLIAKECGLSEPTIRAAIKRLIASGDIIPTNEKMGRSRV